MAMFLIVMSNLLKRYAKNSDPQGNKAKRGKQKGIAFWIRGLAVPALELLR